MTCGTSSLDPGIRLMSTQYHPNSGLDSGGGSVAGPGILTEPVPVRRGSLICHLVSYHRGWKSRSKRNPSPVAARQWPDSARFGREGWCPPIDDRRSRSWTKRAVTHPPEQDRRVRRPVDRHTAGSLCRGTVRLPPPTRSKIGCMGMRVKGCHSMFVRMVRFAPSSI